MTTSTDVAVPQQQSAALSFVPTSPEQVTAALEQWVGGMAAAVRGAEYLVDTPMCPDSFWPVPPNTRTKTPKQMLPNESREGYLERRQVAARTLGSVVRYGLQLGLPPEVAVQGIFTVGGRMSMYAEQMVALVKARGHGHRVVERTRERCVVEVWRHGETEREQFEFTITDAESAGYVPGKGPNANLGHWPDGKPKEGGNAKYLTDPAAMLYARASSIACRTKFPDVLRGLVTYEEMQDEQRSQPVDITATVEVSRPAERTTREAILAAAGQEASQEDHPVTSGNVEPAPAPAQVERAVLPISDPQLRKLGVLFGEIGVKGKGERADRLRIAAEIVGRPLESSKDLTQDEAGVLIDTLEANGHDIAARVLGWDAPAADPMGGADLDHDLDAVADASGEASWPAEDGDQGWPEAAQPGSQA